MVLDFEIKDVQNMEAFEKDYIQLKEAAEIGSRKLVGIGVQRCVAQYHITDRATLERQVQRVADVVWTNSHFAVSTVLAEIIKPYISMPQQYMPTVSLVNHPNIIRTCLALANFIDDEGITMLTTERDDATFFLQTLPGSPSLEHSDLLLLPSTAQALLGKQWSYLCTLYDIPQQGIDIFRKAIQELPSSVLQLPSLTNTAAMPLPNSLVQS